MKLSKYLKDNYLSLLIVILSYIIIFLFLNIFKVDKSLKIVISIIFLIMIISIILINYFRKNTFYKNLINKLDNLDKKYLILEMLNKPNFYEGELFYQTLYEINKSMIEKIKEYSLSIKDFKEYVEMWIHEVKIPISSLTLLNYNNKDVDASYIEQVKILDNYIDQILYYVRSETPSIDYVIVEKSLKDIIKNVALKNKQDLLNNNILLEVNVGNIKVLSDSKWLEFIINGIINNSIKYKKESSIIKIEAKETPTKVYLSIRDTGIGIPKSDLPKVFEKSFTGTNGRNYTKSTGMGLYIAKKLCDKLGHIINVESVVNEYTEVTIIFGKNNYYKMHDNVTKL